MELKGKSILYNAKLKCRINRKINIIPNGMEWTADKGFQYGI